MTRWLVLLLIFVSGVIAGLWSWRFYSLREAPPPAVTLVYEPETLTVDVDLLEAALELAPWVSPGNDGPVLWMIGHRSCDGCDSYIRSDFPTLHAAGVDTRVIYFAPEDTADADERAVLGEIGARRSWRVFTSWTAAAPGTYAAREEIPVAEDPIRAAIITAGRRTRDEVNAVMRQNGFDTVYPLFFWRGDDGRWRVVSGDTTRGRRAIRVALTGGE